MSRGEDNDVVKIPRFTEENGTKTTRPSGRSTPPLYDVGPVGGGFIVNVL